MQEYQQFDADIVPVACNLIKNEIRTKAFFFYEF